MEDANALLGYPYCLTGKVTGGSRTFTRHDGRISYTLGWDDNNHDHFTTTVVWTVPRK